MGKRLFGFLNTCIGQQNDAVVSIPNVKRFTQWLSAETFCVRHCLPNLHPPQFCPTCPPPPQPSLFSVLTRSQWLFLASCQLCLALTFLNSHKREKHITVIIHIINTVYTPYTKKYLHFISQSKFLLSEGSFISQSVCHFYLSLLLYTRP